MHLAKRNLQMHSGYSQNQLQNMSPLITSTLEHFFAFSRKYYFEQLVVGDKRII